LGQAAVRRKQQAIGWRELQATAHARGDVVLGFDVVALHINDADCDISVFGDALN
jgi:hypothetical protein